jgi:cytochrome P450
MTEETTANTSPPPESQPIDLFSREFKANPFPTYACLRESAPIYPHHAPDGSTIWYITRYEDALTVLRDDEAFCKDQRHAHTDGEAGPASRRSGGQQAINENMLFSDPPEHTRLRGLVSKAFTPRRIEALIPEVQSIADELLDGVQDACVMDLIADFALPLPIYVISELLGVPRADREEVADWSQAIISPGSRNLTYSARKRRVRSLTRYLDALFALRAADPREDLISALVQVEESGTKLSEAELSSMVVLLLVTGHETVVNLIGNGALALLGAPEQLARLQQEPGLWEAAIEELLRFDGPVETSTSRWARRDVVLQGHQIRRGDLIRVVLSSANRDERQFTEPAALQIDRQHNKHLAFGFGIHYCLGAPLARIEGRIALETLFRRLPDLRLALPPDQVAWRSGVLFRGMQRCDVIWSPIRGF